MTSPAANVAQLCRQLDMKVHEYGDLATARAEAEVDYKSARARRILRARADGEARSITEAENIAAADQGVEQLWRRHLVADAQADACNKAILALRERIGYGRSLMATAREADRLHATDPGVT